MNKQLAPSAAFAIGLAAVGWVGYGYLGTNALALTMTLLIGAVYLTGGLELRRFGQATSSLESALAALPENLSDLGDWLASLHPSLRNAVRLRIEGERIGLPGPALTPYLVGLLVLLGMLGTFVGMVVTLQGAVMALESTTDLPTIRAALAAPVRGLGLAFGTSVAGVAASAMLGLLSALRRRERLQAAQRLDTRIATTLRVFSLAHQRQLTLESLQQQARAMPEVVAQLQAMVAQMARHGEATNERLLAGQDRFYRHAQSAYADLASAVDRSLEKSLTESARIAGATIQPVVEATMRGIAAETAGFQQRMAEKVQQQLDGVGARFAATATAVADGWTGALARHDRSSQTLVDGLQRSLDGFTERFERQAGSLLDAVDARGAAAQREMQASLSDMAQQTAALHERVAGTVQRQLDGVGERLAATADAVSENWRDALVRHQRTSDSLSAGLETSLAALADSFEQRSASLLATVDRAHAALQAASAAGDQQRLATWSRSMDALAASLQREWQQAGEQSLVRQQKICATLEQTAREIHARAESHSRDTIGQIARLIDAASEAPRAAAEVMAALRQQHSDSIARDNGLLDERSRIMANLGMLLDAVNRATGEQREAIDALVSSSSALLQQAGTRFGEKIAAESAKMAEAAAQVTGGAVEVASMGEAFGFAVQRFGESSEALMDHLQRIEGALGKSTARSDEQLAYYVAQAREIVDLSISSQRLIVEDLQQLAIRQAPLAAEAA